MNNAFYYGFFYAFCNTLCNFPDMYGTAIAGREFPLSFMLIFGSIVYNWALSYKHQNFLKVIP